MRTGPRGAEGSHETGLERQRSGEVPRGTCFSVPSVTAPRPAFQAPVLRSAGGFYRSVGGQRCVSSSSESTHPFSAAGDNRGRGHWAARSTRFTPTRVRTTLVCALTLLAVYGPPPTRVGIRNFDTTPGEAQDGSPPRTWG